MIERYTHVFRYGAKLHGGAQRWAFRFAIPDPEPRVGRGRPAALAIVFCAGLRNAQGETVQFLEARDAALTADAWKCFLNRTRGMRGVDWSLGSYDNAAAAYLTAFGRSIEDYEPCVELAEFLRANEEAMQKLEAQAESLAWNPDVVLHSAERNLSRAQENGLDTNQAHAVRQWAVDFKDHMKLVSEFENFGPAKFEMEISRYIALVERALKCAPWHLPTKAHYRLLRFLDKYRARRAAMAKLLEDLKAEQLELRVFSESLPLRTEELKRERVKLSCATPGGTPNGSENGCASLAETTTEKSSTNLLNENKTS